MTSWYRRHVVGSWRTLFAAILVVAAANAGALALYVTRPAPYRPLGDYTVQKVDLPVTYEDADLDSTTADEQLPTLYIHRGQTRATVPVVAVKCSTHDGELDIESTWRWRNVIPPGFTSPDLTSQSTLQSGCTTIRYENQVPAEVFDRAKTLADQGRYVSIEQIQGNDRPLVDNGAPTYWQTQNFAVVYVP